MRRRLAAAGLVEISEKLDSGTRLDFEDGVRLFECSDLFTVGWLANRERERRYGHHTFYNHNIRLEATNVCEASCLFCAFARLGPDDKGAYTLTLEQALDKLRQRRHQPVERATRSNTQSMSIPSLEICRSKLGTDPFRV